MTIYTAKIVRMSRRRQKIALLRRAVERPMDFLDIPPGSMNLVKINTLDFKCGKLIGIDYTAHPILPVEYFNFTVQIDSQFAPFDRHLC